MSIFGFEMYRVEDNLTWHQPSKANLIKLLSEFSAMVVSDRVACFPKQCLRGYICNVLVVKSRQKLTSDYIGLMSFFPVIIDSAELFSSCSARYPCHHILAKLTI